MRLWNTLLSRGIGAGLDTLAIKVFTSLVQSKTFRTTVVETEKAIIKGIRYAGNPEKETRAFQQREKEVVDYLADQARTAASGNANKPPQPKPSTIVPPNMTASGYQPESELTRWFKTKKYEFGIMKQKWFG